MVGTQIVLQLIDPVDVGDYVAARATARVGKPSNRPDQSRNVWGYAVLPGVDVRA